MQKGTYVAPVSHYEGEEDDGGWTVIDKKTKEVEARLAKKKQQKKAAQTAGQKQAAEIKKEAKLDTTTLFSTFQELMDRKEQEKQAELAKKAVAQQKKAKDAPPPLPAAEVVAPTLDADDLQSRIDNWKNKYADKAIQLKCLADYFFEKLGELSYESADSALPFTENFLGVCSTFLSSVSEEASAFLEFLISTHLAHLEKKRRGCGIFPLLQITLSLYAHHIVDSIETIKTKCTTKTKMGPIMDKTNGPNILALISEIKRVNSRAALHCWLELILPTLISIKDMQVRSQYISLLEAIVAEKFKADKGSYPAAESLLLFINFFYSDKLHKSHRARIQAIFQKVLNANVFFNDKSPHLFFQSLLSASSEPAQNPEHTPEREQTIFELMTRCLSQDLKCGKNWKSIYPYVVPQSNNLLVHIDKNWKAGTGGVPELTKGPKRNAFHRDLLQILKSFDDQNNTLSTGGAIDGDEEQTMKALKLSESDLGITSATLRQLERTMGAAPVLQADGTDAPDPKSSGSGFGQIFLTLCFLLLIYFVYVKGIEFSDVKLFLKEGQTKLGL